MTHGLSRFGIAVRHVDMTDPATEVVHFPGLPAFPPHALAKRRMRQFGGMVAFELHGGLAAGITFMDALSLVTRAVSPGDAETLAQHPASMMHSTYTAQERAAHGIGEGLVRLSVGLEDTEDLLADIRQALDRVQRRGTPQRATAPARACAEPA